MENENSFAMELLTDFKKQNKRMFVIWIITFLTLIGLTCYTIYLLNDIGTIEETTITNDVTQDNDSGNNNFIGGDGDITNGNTEDKTNSK